MGRPADMDFEKKRPAGPMRVCTWLIDHIDRAFRIPSSAMRRSSFILKQIHRKRIGSHRGCAKEMFSQIACGRKTRHRQPKHASPKVSLAQRRDAKKRLALAQTRSVLELRWCKAAKCLPAHSGTTETRLLKLYCAFVSRNLSACKQKR